MKKKSSVKTRHVVAWINKAEWDQVLDYLYSKDAALQKHALHRISAWKGRFGHSTPVAVESTADLVRCQVIDSSGQLDPDDLVLLYGMALVRFVNLITERQQRGVARPLRRLASNLNIPEWIVNLRHDLTHRRLPTLKWCRKGCRFVLDWLQQEYWSRQLGSRLAEDWDSPSEEEEDEEWTRKREEALLTRQREIERHKKARDLLVSYEREQFQVYEELLKQGTQWSLWPEPNADLSWILAQIKHFTTESSEILTDALVQDGFLIPTAEQLESLDLDSSEGAVDPCAPHVPRVFLRFWLPLLKVLNSPSFILLILDKLFAELANNCKLSAELTNHSKLSAQQANHRAFYLAAWVSEILLCNSKGGLFPGESKPQWKQRMKEKLFSSRQQLHWNQLITACLNAPCLATPHLLTQILEDMDKPLPPDTQHKLLRLCSIYTQAGGHGNCSPSNADPTQPVYTLQSLLRGEATPTPISNHTPGSTQAPSPMELQETLSDSCLQDRNTQLRGSAWTVCIDKVPWQLYPLGKVPGQAEDPACLMLESYSTLTVFDQQVELDKPVQSHGNTSTPVQHRPAAEGPLWTHSDLSKIKAGLKLF